MNVYLGQTEKSPLFLRLIAPTKLQRVTQEMIEEFKARYKWDLINTRLWSLIGLDGGPVEEFLENYVRVSRELGIHVTPKNIDRFVEALTSRYGYDKRDVHEYIDVFLTVYKAGFVPTSLYKPYTVDVDEAGRGPLVPTEGIEKAGALARGAFGGMLKTAWPVVIGVVAVRALTSNALPKIIEARTSRRGREEPENS